MSRPVEMPRHFEKQFSRRLRAAQGMRQPFESRTMQRENVGLAGRLGWGGSNAIFDRIELSGTTNRKSRASVKLCRFNAVLGTPRFFQKVEAAGPLTE